jgi:predicted signal transduction protein with EAL and GGDEF domain
VARYGGDEFVLVLNNHYQVSSVVQVLERVLEEIQRPMVLEQQELCVTCSIGLSLYPADGADSLTLIQHADAAMYSAKEQGKNNFRFFTRRMNEIATERVTMEVSLRRALAREELKVVYQPKVDAEGFPYGVEALLRWHSPEHGLVSPDKFIPLAEETGLIDPITEFVLERACWQAMEWVEKGYPPLTIAVNLSARSLKDESLAEKVDHIFRRAGLPADRLEIELTEGMLIDDVEASVATLRALKAKGVRLAIDDFGTGYSSLSYLQRFPIDILKIDRAFVRNLHENPGEKDITRLIVLLGSSLGLEVVAEGVETRDQLRHLQALGCSLFQGYYFAKPMAPEELEQKFLLRYLDQMA